MLGAGLLDDDDSGESITDEERAALDAEAAAELDDGEADAAQEPGSAVVLVERPDRDNTIRNVIERVPDDAPEDGDTATAISLAVLEDDDWADFEAAGSSDDGFEISADMADDAETYPGDESDFETMPETPALDLSILDPARQ